MDYFELQIPLQYVEIWTTQYETTFISYSWIQLNVHCFYHMVSNNTDRH